MNIGSIGYSISALTFLIFFGILLTDKRRGAAKKLLIIAAISSSLWAVSMAYQAVTGSDLITPQILEFIKHITWITFLLRMLSIAYGAGVARAGLRIALGTIILFVLVMIFVLMYPVMAVPMELSLNSRIMEVDLSPDGQLGLTGTGDGVVSLW